MLHSAKTIMPGWTSGMPPEPLMTWLLVGLSVLLLLFVVGGIHMAARAQRGRGLAGYRSEVAREPGRAERVTGIAFRVVLAAAVLGAFVAIVWLSDVAR